jgi:hypothetical protein
VSDWLAEEFVSLSGDDAAVPLLAVESIFNLFVLFLGRHHHFYISQRAHARWGLYRDLAFQCAGR